MGCLLASIFFGFCSALGGTQLDSQNSPGAHQNRIKIELQLQPGFGSVLGTSWSEKSLFFMILGSKMGVQMLPCLPL